MSETLKRYWIEVRGFDGHEVKAATAGKARYATYRAWCEAGFDRTVSGRVNFKDFLSRIETFHHLGASA